MSMQSAKFRRAPETTFLTVDQEVFDRLSPYALKVYGQLRKLTSYTKENDETEITVKNLAKASGISVRKTYDVLNELEYEHYIIQRHNIYHIRYGQINSFDVSQTYGFFKRHKGSKPVDNFAQNLSPTAPRAVPYAQYAAPTAQYAEIYNKEQESSQELFKKQNNTVFSDTDSVKTHVESTSEKKGQPLDEDTVMQIVFYIGMNLAITNVKKKTNIALKLIREGKWNIPQGYKGITSQSIREKEEREHREKQEQYQQEASAFRDIQRKLSPQAAESLSTILKRLKTA